MKCRENHRDIKGYEIERNHRDIERILNAEKNHRDIERILNREKS